MDLEKRVGELEIMVKKLQIEVRNLKEGLSKSK